jgi:RND family efflux transporter MFP subunit
MAPAPSTRLSVVAALALGAGLAGCQKEDTATAPPPPQPVQVVTIAPQSLQERWTLVGVVRPRVEADLGFRVPGKVAARLVDVGQRVEAGQEIARLDESDLRLQREQQEAELRAASTGLDQAAAAEARSRVLLDKGHIAQAALDEKRAAADEARARLDRAKRGLDLAGNQLAYAVLRADRAGVVSALPVEAGQVVVAGQPVARIADLGGLEVEVAVPEHRLDAVKDAAATVTFWGSAAAPMPARLRELAPEADAATRTYRARFSLPAVPAGIELGRTATLSLMRGEAREIVRLPLAAVMNDGRGAAVWVVDASGRKVERRPIGLAALAADGALIDSGLAAGERVVSLGVHLVDEGKPVRIVEQRSVAPEEPRS